MPGGPATALESKFRKLWQELSSARNAELSSCQTVYY